MWVIGDDTHQPTRPQPVNHRRHAHLHTSIPTYLNLPPPVQATSRGTSWFQPFVQLPSVPGSPGAAAMVMAAVAAAAGARERVKPQGCFTVLVQPPVPLVRVSGATRQHSAGLGWYRSQWGAVCFRGVRVGGLPLPSTKCRRVWQCCVFNSRQGCCSRMFSEGFVSAMF